MIPNGSINEILDHKGGAVWTVAPDATVFEAIQMMSRKMWAHCSLPNGISSLASFPNAITHAKSR